MEVDYVILGMHLDSLYFVYKFTILDIIIINRISQLSFEFTCYKGEFSLNGAN